MRIWVDADACPSVIKDIIYKAAERLKIETILVANQHVKLPASAYIKGVLVSKGFDVADAYIVKNLQKFDMVITADIPLADLVVKQGAVAINPRGEIYNESSISEKLSIRNFTQVLREGGLVQGGPAPLNSTDKQKFAATFDKHLTLLLKKEKQSS
ncbi:YaiI/YqxD family protein [Spirobacillus cienkowskii]|uniref:UPF0178 protein DCC88_08920 n=1 Tax=Spirobacillus cienkowskii TaxID=495820 RepID=A0A369KM00_9BACT|nr:MAG: YaiI/YqxD family protein [Spirobacillus cienkowskii]